ncbi:MAG: LuxR C-terminal-related transcriptional regulator [Gammaproteobacteria bacterium]|nr:LuxR C-terminal-related transcriptional regulator [Gammaproteobacteria bacterium]
MTDYNKHLAMNRMQPPRPIGPLVERAGLLSRIKQCDNAHLIVIHAPAGFGKTVLLSQYYQWLQENNTVCGWLTLDNIENEPVRILAYLIASLDATGFVPEDILASALTGFQGFAEKDAFNLSVNCIAGFKIPTCIFLDDHHALRAEATQQLVTKLIELTFDNVRFVVASREFPSSLKGRVQISRSFFELTASDLALTQAETRAFLEGSGETKIADKTARLLYAKSEGWPAAIEFASIWLGNNGATGLEGFINQSIDFSAFISTEIFNVLPEQLQRVMVNMSVVSYFDGDVINSLCETEDGWRMLEELYRFDLIVPVDETGKCYRYHHLLAEFLQERFCRKSRFAREQIFTRAAEWYLTLDQYNEALKFALATKDMECIAAVVERSGGWRHVIDGRISTFSSALENLSPAVMRRYPRTYLGHIMLKAKSGDILGALGDYDEFRSDTRDFTVLDDCPLPPDFAVEAKTVDFFLGGLEDRPQTPQYIAKINDTLKGLPEGEHFLRANLLNCLSYAYFDGGDFEKAYQSGEEAISHRRELNLIYGENFLYFHLGKSCLAQARLRDAEQLYQKGYQMAVDNFGSNSDMAALACAHLAETCYDRNEIEQAQEHLEIAFSRIEQSEAWFDVYISAYFTAVKVASVLGNDDDVRRILLRASDTGKRRNIRRLRLLAVNQYIRHLIAKGKFLKANWMIKRLQFEQLIDETSGQEFVSYRVKEEIGLTLSYYLIENGAMSGAIKLLNQLLTVAKRNNCRRSLISLNILIALAYFKLRKYKQALVRLNESISHAIYEGFKRPFLEYGDSQVQLLEMALSNNHLLPINRLKQSFLVELTSIVKQDSNRRRRGASGLLSSREKEILKHVYDGCSNKEIAKFCDCSVNTVKFHMKNIFSKLNVNDRKSLARLTWGSHL